MWSERQRQWEWWGQQSEMQLQQRWTATWHMHIIRIIQNHIQWVEPLKKRLIENPFAIRTPSLLQKSPPKPNPPSPILDACTVSLVFKPPIFIYLTISEYWWSHDGSCSLDYDVDPTLTTLGWLQLTDGGNDQREEDPHGTKRLESEDRHAYNMESSEIANRSCCWDIVDRK